jgi:hypothetical protein
MDADFEKEWGPFIAEHPGMEEPLLKWKRERSRNAALRRRAARHDDIMVKCYCGCPSPKGSGTRAGPPAAHRSPGLPS